MADNPLYQLLRPGPGFRLGRQEYHADAVFTKPRQYYPQVTTFLLVELVGHLDEDAGAVASFRVAAAGPPVAQVDQDLKGLCDDFVGLAALDISDHSHAAAI